MSLTLVIANKNYSSWSLRPWLAMKVAGLSFEEILVPLDTPQTKALIAQHSPAGRVPVLKDGDVTVWDSLAIIEYIHENHAPLWPKDKAARAVARSISAEMHSGFQGLRGHYPMNIRKRVTDRPPTPAAAADIERVLALWTDARERFGQGGDFLFGAFSAADAMYAPVVWRFESYGVPVPAKARAYMDAVQALPAMREWSAAGLAEPWTVPSDEV